MEMSHRVELLAPAGNAESFYGAVHAGADAVYLAGDRFGARAYAENFTSEELVKCIRYGHLLGRKIYLTVNTLLKEQELVQLYDYLAPFYEAGLDAVIVQDLGVLRFIREHFPGLKLHASTQMTLCSRYGASLLKDMGASRIVPARELSLEELIVLKQCGVEIETFIHGAMCYCYSGQCLFSSILGGRSGNRGRCAQPCRLPYSINMGGKAGESHQCYPLSLKDMCTIEHLPKLIGAGIDSFKIEGRMKKPEYAAGVTGIYRRYIDRYYELREERGPAEAAKIWHVEKRDSDILSSLYIRSEIQDGYYFRRNGREMITLDSPAYSGSDEKVLAQIREKYLSARQKLSVRIKASFQIGQPAEVIFQWQELTARVSGSLVERAQKQPIRMDNIKMQLEKLGDTCFSAAETDIRLDEGCFYPLKQINELRRAAVSELEGKILLWRGYGVQRKENFSDTITTAAVSKQRVISFHSYEPPQSDTYQEDARMTAKPKTVAVSACTTAQLRAMVKWFSAAGDMPLRVYVDSDMLLRGREEVVGLCQKLPDKSTVYAALPYIIRESDRAYLEKLSGIIENLRKDRSVRFRGFLARSMDGIGFVRKQQRGQACESSGLFCEAGLFCRTDAGVYVWNRIALQEVESLADGFCLPYELNASEQRSLLGESCEKIVYGRIPMMITANCLLRTEGRCRKNSTASVPVFLTDRMHRKFPVSVDCLHCVNIIYNSVPFSLHRELSKWEGRVDIRLDFTLETEAETVKLLDAFLADAAFPLGEYTTGHEKRGVE